MFILAPARRGTDPTRPCRHAGNSSLRIARFVRVEQGATTTPCRITASAHAHRSGARARETDAVVSVARSHGDASNSISVARCDVPYYCQCSRSNAKHDGETARSRAAATQTSASSASLKLRRRHHAAVLLPPQHPLNEAVLECETAQPSSRARSRNGASPQARTERAGAGLTESEDAVARPWQGAMRTMWLSALQCWAMQSRATAPQHRLSESLALAAGSATHEITVF